MSNLPQAPPPYDGEFTGVWQLPPPSYSEAVAEPSNQLAHEVLIVCGGWDGDRALDTMEIFDPTKGEWSMLPNMMAPRRDHGAVVVGDFMYVVGGWNMEPYYSSTEKYNITLRSWSRSAPLSGPRGWPGVAAMGDFIYCVGGYDHKEKALKVVERMNVREERWESINGLNKARGGCGLVEHSGCLYAIGGYNGDRALKSVERFDPKEGKWRTMADMDIRREDLSHSCAVYNNNIVVMGGVDDDEKPLASGSMYNPATDNWRPMQAHLVREKRGLSISVVGGVMFAAGGEDRNDQNLEMVMMFNTNSQAWQPWHPMRGGRAGHAAVVIRPQQQPIGAGGFAF